MSAITIAFAITLFETIPMMNIFSIPIKYEEEHLMAVLSSGGVFAILKEEIEKKIRRISGRNTARNSKTNLIHQGFRIEEDVVKLLANEASKRQISLSNLVNMILRNHVTHNFQNLGELGFIPVRKDFLRKVFNVIQVGEAEEVGKSLGFSLSHEYVTSFFPQLDSSTLILFLETWLGRFQSFRHRIEEHVSHNIVRHTFSVDHDINLNFSVALKVMLVGLIEPIIKTIVIFGDPTSNGIVFSFDLEYDSQLGE